MFPWCVCVGFLGCNLGDSKHPAITSWRSFRAHLSPKMMTTIATAGRVLVYIPEMKMGRIGLFPTSKGTSWRTVCRTHRHIGRRELRSRLSADWVFPFWVSCDGLEQYDSESTCSVMCIDLLYILEVDTLTYFKKPKLIQNSRSSLGRWSDYKVENITVRSSCDWGSG